MDCTFCKIISGEFDSAKIYEDNDVVAFLDIKPVTKGHALVIPKKHFENIFDIEKTILEKVSTIGKKVSERLKEKLAIDGIRLVQSNGAVAGQMVFHFHLHVIPRYKNDGLGTRFGDMQTSTISKEELKQLAEQLKI